MTYEPVEIAAGGATLVGDRWNETAGRAMLEEMLTREGGELVYAGASVVAGVAHWQPRARD